MSPVRINRQAAVILGFLFVVIVVKVYLLLRNDFEELANLDIANTVRDTEPTTSDDKEPEIIERSPDRPRLKGKLRDSITLYSEKENESTAIEDKLIPDGNINDIFPH